MAFGTVTFLDHLSAATRIDLEADMQVSAGQIIEVYVNDPMLPPYRASILPNERHVYRFEGIPANLKYLRIDPTEAPDSHFSLYSVSIVSAGRILRNFGPADLRLWRTVNMTASDNSAALVAVSTTNDPAMATDLSFVAATSPPWVSYITDLFRRPHFYTLGSILCFLAFLAAGIGTRRAPSMHCW